MLLQTIVPKWLKEELNKFAKSKGLTMTDINKLAIYFFILNYQGKFNHDTLDRIEFEARKKIESQK